MRPSRRSGKSNSDHQVLQHRGSDDKGLSSGAAASSSSKALSHRYAPVAEKGDNAWKREWGGFMSNIKMLEGGNRVKLPSSMDIAVEAQRWRRRGEDEDVTREDDNDDDDDSVVGGCSPAAAFGYLFSGAAEKRAERDMKREAVERERIKKKREQKLAQLKAAQERGEAVGVDWSDPLNERSKHQTAMLEAQRRGLKLDGMSRKQVRQFLHLSVSAEQQQALAAQRELKPHELMDPKLQWYQQGPYPLDVISEKLVNRKAAKHCKQSGMRYNYLGVHPSWLASRARKRVESRLEGTGVRVEFTEDGDEDGSDCWKALRIMSAKLFAERHQPVVEEEHQRTEGHPVSQRLGSRRRAGATATPVPAVTMTEREKFRQEIQRANLTTNFMSSALVHSPSIGLDDDRDARLPMTFAKSEPQRRKYSSRVAGEDDTRLGSALKPVAESNPKGSVRDGASLSPVVRRRQREAPCATRTPTVDSLTKRKRMESSGEGPSKKKMRKADVPLPQRNKGRE